MFVFQRSSNSVSVSVSLSAADLSEGVSPFLPHLPASCSLSSHPLPTSSPFFFHLASLPSFSPFASVLPAFVLPNTSIDSSSTTQSNHHNQDGEGRNGGEKKRKRTGEDQRAAVATYLVNSIPSAILSGAEIEAKSQSVAVAAVVEKCRRVENQIRIVSGNLKMSWETKIRERLQQNEKEIEMELLKLLSSSSESDNPSEANQEELINRLFNQEFHSFIETAKAGSLASLESVTWTRPPHVVAASTDSTNPTHHNTNNIDISVSTAVSSSSTAPSSRHSLSASYPLSSAATMSSAPILPLPPVVPNSTASVASSSYLPVCDECGARIEGVGVECTACGYDPLDESDDEEGQKKRKRRKAQLASTKLEKKRQHEEQIKKLASAISPFAIAIEQSNL